MLMLKKEVERDLNLYSKLHKNTCLQTAPKSIVRCSENVNCFVTAAL